MHLLLIKWILVRFPCPPQRVFFPLRWIALNCWHRKRSLLLVQTSLRHISHIASLNFQSRVKVTLLVQVALCVCGDFWHQIDRCLIFNRSSPLQRISAKVTSHLCIVWLTNIFSRCSPSKLCHFDNCSQRHHTSLHEYFCKHPFQWVFPH